MKKEYVLKIGDNYISYFNGNLQFTKYKDKAYQFNIIEIANAINEIQQSINIEEIKE